MIAVLCTIVALPTVGCAQSASPPSPDHAEIAAIFAADQGDRAPTALAGLAPAARDSVMRSVMARDTVRRARLEALMRLGVARTAVDYFRASVVVQHGRDTLASRKAHEWARQAVAIDSSHTAAKRMIAASWDQYQAGLGRPRWYSVGVVGGLREPARLTEIDTTRVTDAERLRLGLRPLAEQMAVAQRMVDSLNARRRQIQRSPASAGERRGMAWPPHTHGILSQ